jgi:hypothetical protein
MPSDQCKHTVAVASLAIEGHWRAGKRYSPVPQLVEVSSEVLALLRSDGQLVVAETPEACVELRAHRCGAGRLAHQARLDAAGDDE